MNKTKYHCVCAACGHSFFSDEMPCSKRCGLFKSIFSKERSSAEGHRSPAVPLKDNDFKSSVRCPECGARHVILGGVID